MQPARKTTIATRDVWQKGLDTLRATWRQTVIITVLGLILPQLAVSLYFDSESGQAVKALKDMAATPPSQGLNFAALIAPGLEFVGRLGFAVLVLGLVSLTAYLALVQLAVRHHRQEPAAELAVLFRSSLSLALRRGLILVVALALLLAFGQLLIAPAILVAALSLNLPVILVAERQGAWRSLVSALGLRYVRQTRHSGWAVLFVLLSIGATLYVAVVLIALLVEFLMHADQSFGLHRGFWAMTFPGVTFGPVYLIASTLETVLLMAAVAIYPSLTTALYFRIVDKRDLGQA